MIEKSVIINTKFRGIHTWKNCPFDKVDFLRNEHHHEFDVHMEVTITDSDRELQFIRLQYVLETIIHNLYPNYNELKKDDMYNNIIQKLFPNNNFIPYTAYLGNRSCQMIAEQIIKQFININSNYNYSIIIYEDGHYGGKYKFIKD